MLDLVPAPRGGATLVSTVMDTIRQRIENRALAPGAKVPSIRRLAESLGVSKSTVVEAYDRLAAEGAIAARPGSGFYVARRAQPLTLAEPGRRLDRTIDPLWIARQALETPEAGEQVLKPGCGWLPADWMPDPAIRRALRGLARSEGEGLVDYDSPLGFAPLRRHLAGRLAERGITAEAGQMLLTDGGTQAIDLIGRFLLEPGDAVLVDDPCYFNFLGVLRAHRAKGVGVPRTPAGPDLDAFARAAAEHRPRLFVTNAALHNPTGASLAPQVAHRLLMLAEAHDLVVVEDDIFADFETEPSPRLAALDGLQRVIHIGSFSKTLSAAVRCGFIAARPDWIEGLTDLKLATSFSNGALAARLVHRLLTDGSYRRHVEGLRGRLARAMGETARRLAALGLMPWVEPRGGMFLWAALPEGLDSAEVARRALARDVVLAPGDVFSPSRTAGRFLRFNVAQSASPRIFAVLEEAMRG
ncbi:PLP-dependent aminotransferase family protein [Inquilinus limosus]|uniref:aminotransferase-like domain-containing protein n=1 Tax=Inquilinus limosus TaxID=171674 RepID=UPI003F14F9C0